MPRGRSNGGNATIKDMLKRPPPLRQTLDSEEDDLRIALQLSKQEHVNEQKRIFEQLARLSRQGQTENEGAFRFKKRRIIQKESDGDEDGDIIVKEAKDTEEEDQWFQTVSSRPQTRRIPLSKSELKERTKKIIEKKPVKKEPEKNQVLLDIDDVSELLNATTKEEEKEESYDLTSLLMDESDTNITEDRNDAEAAKDEQSDSDCSVIDLVETPWIEDIPGEEDDGYLSPLEGFTSLNDVRDDASYSNYYNQFTPSTSSATSNKPKATRKRKTTSTSTPKKKKFYKKKFWTRKRK